MVPDPPLFPRHQEVEMSWRVLDPVLESVASPDSHGVIRAGRRSSSSRTLSAARAANTSASSREFEAMRQAPCSPVHAVSPIA